MWALAVAPASQVCAIAVPRPLAKATGHAGSAARVQPACGVRCAALANAFAALCRRGLQVAAGR